MRVDLRVAGAGHPVVEPGRDQPAGVLPPPPRHPVPPFAVMSGAMVPAAGEHRLLLEHPQRLVDRGVMRRPHLPAHPPAAGGPQHRHALHRRKRQVVSVDARPVGPANPPLRRRPLLRLDLPALAPGRTFQLRPGLGEPLAHAAVHPPGPAQRLPRSRVRVLPVHRPERLVRDLTRQPEERLAGGDPAARRLPDLLVPGVVVLRAVRHPAQQIVEPLRRGELPDRQHHSHRRAARQRRIRPTRR